jgi:hypothetical protein
MRTAAPVATPRGSVEPTRRRNGERQYPVHARVSCRERPYVVRTGVGWDLATPVVLRTAGPSAVPALAAFGHVQVEVRDLLGLLDCGEPLVLVHRVAWTDRTRACRARQGRWSTRTAAAPAVATRASTLTDDLFRCDRPYRPDRPPPPGRGSSNSRHTDTSRDCQYTHRACTVSCRNGTAEKRFRVRGVRRRVEVGAQQAIYDCSGQLVVSVSRGCSFESTSCNRLSVLLSSFRCDRGLHLFTTRPRRRRVF